MRCLELKAEFQKLGSISVNSRILDIIIRTPTRDPDGRKKVHFSFVI